MRFITLVLWVSLCAGCTAGYRRPLQEAEAIVIATKALTSEPNWPYTVSATQYESGEWLVLFEGKSALVGDYVFVHLDRSGKVRRKSGGL